MSQREGVIAEYLSSDTVMGKEQVTSYPVELFKALELSEVPSDKMRFKFGVPVLLIRNIDTTRLINGTRLQITYLGAKLVRATVKTGIARGERVLIPLIPLIPTDLSFQFKTLQFL
ncbi:hypothetical protein AVEN_64344-1 [Araneus ventricosus]|uniref:DNA helicase Pif1-like 2B domain-containing protein n=1 Tax=Araneus ventricosus TaxID=182803 RepID=A0A4Y2D8T8_ARAVE|nr:hypothetical protein AVEN_64344-1 [Araneus ventricosus]